MDTIKIIVMNEEIEIYKGTTLLELSKSYQSKFKYPIILGRVDFKYRELSYIIEESCDIEFFDLKKSLANKVYINGLIYVMIYAVKELFGNNSDIKVLHSIDKGIYIETVNFSLDDNNLKLINDKMIDIIKSNMPLTRVSTSRNDAIEYFKKIGDYTKVGILQYNVNSYVTLYKLGNLYNYFFSPMVVSTNFLSEFQLQLVDNCGLVLQYITTYEDGISQYVEHPNTFKVFKEHREWAELMKIKNVPNLNELVSQGNINDLIRMSETLSENKLLNVAKEIYNKKAVKIILIAGPSSSGKTTTANKLSMYLRSFGLNPQLISMDDYFVDRKDLEVDKFGKYDFENLKAIDLELFNTQMKDLLNKKEVKIPTYNFILGMKEYKKTLKLSENDILIIEGIHGLNNIVLEGIDKSLKCKIYLSALTQLGLDNHNKINTTDNRLLRRIIRDNRTRGYDATKTLESWSSVRRGEEKYIFPYQDDADYTINTALIYEMGVLKTYVEPLLYSVKEESLYYEEARRLINFLRVFLPIPSDSVPEDSILREFIGGSCF